LNDSSSVAIDSASACSAMHATASTDARAVSALKRRWAGVVNTGVTDQVAAHASAA